MTIQEALNKLYSLHIFGVKLGLNNTLDLMNHLGNPQKKLKCIHIAGSNGKGSTASLIASMLMEMGYKVGLYTSPHFVKFNERVRINNVMIEDEYITKFITDLESYIDENKPTYFEVTTALAFKYFSENEIDYAVIETGLGGRLDSTNVIDPLASVITNIFLEHTNILGNEIAGIAREKGGIIKDDKITVLGKMNFEAESILSSLAVEKNSKLILLSKLLSECGDEIKLALGNENIHLYESVLPGRHQIINAALALLTVKTIFEDADTNLLLDGIKKVKINSGIEGRYEIYNHNPKIIFDSAHNKDGLNSFLEQFNLEKDNYKKTCIIFGAMCDKDLRGMLILLKQNIDTIFITEIDYERSAKIDELIQICSELEIEAHPLIDPVSFLNEVKTNRNYDCVICTGSMYLLGDIKSRIK
ncbi:MAG: bifunctional folylpolyglutamate synthase/dihydrofolate synthase [Melioribacteraceae bacterium]|nr:bifunctional folylpolyglutamate synthase/dihydrofolate synthase [Melioribacteraceae bacterium]MCF8354865.1 bifunctional folylpolyglutamate synthase/dihydrofolate synthase [Melioribacteraceae bacterium]MCF8392972.1 bifunctional folylpolyglutamate synthase/dihydrofolate synthase [Melioribacteraceae bacterium]MCF8417285.1 bifunctional folylpolyglutamate synthase/dihydrofolate synthase [Melioribacteraceae bacterium]